MSDDAIKDAIRISMELANSADHHDAAQHQRYAASGDERRAARSYAFISQLAELLHQNDPALAAALIDFRDCR